MKPFFRPQIIFFAILVQLTIHFTLEAQTISLPNEWKFKFGDNSEWANPAFNDSDCGTQQRAKSFTRDFSYAGTHRIKIITPSVMKTATGKGIKLHLGKIDDADQTFLMEN